MPTYVHLTIMVTEDEVTPQAGLSSGNWTMGAGMPQPDSLATVRKGGRILERVLDFADQIKASA